MTPKSFDEWKALYEEKTGDKFEPKDGFTLIYLPERGFADMKIDTEGKIVVVNQTCGDAKFWRDVAELIANSWRCEAVCTICTRHILPYIRIFGGEIIKEYIHPATGQKRYLCQDSTGRKATATYQGTNAKGEPQYLMTHYIHEKVSLDDIEELSPKDGDKDVDE